MDWKCVNSAFVELRLASLYDVIRDSQEKFSAFGHCNMLAVGKAEQMALFVLQRRYIHQV